MASETSNIYMVSALSNNELVFHHQTQVALLTGQVSVSAKPSGLQFDPHVAAQAPIFKKMIFEEI